MPDQERLERERRDQEEVKSPSTVEFVRKSSIMFAKESTARDRLNKRLRLDYQRHGEPDGFESAERRPWQQ